MGKQQGLEQRVTSVRAMGAQWDVEEQRGFSETSRRAANSIGLVEEYWGISGTSETVMGDQGD